MTKLKQTKKLEMFVVRQDKHHELHPQGLERWVVNVTDWLFSKPQENMLRLG